MKRIVFSALAALSIAAGAQNLSTEITVDRTIVPEEQTATPLPSVRPAFVKPLTTPTVLNPTEYTMVTEYVPVAGLFGAPAYDGVPAPSDFRGYVRAGYFPTYNLGLDFGYRVLTDKVNRLGVGASFEGSSYKSKEVADNRTVSDNTLGVQADYAHTFATGAVLGVNADYFHSALKSPISHGEQQKQGIDAFKISADFGRSSTKFSYKASACFDRFGMREPVAGLPGATSNLLDVKLRGAGALGDDLGYTVGIGGGLLMGDGYWWRLPGVGYEGKKKIGNVTFNPALVFDMGSFKARLGAVLNYSRDFDGNHFHAAPDMLLSYSPASAYTIFAEVSGGEHFASLRSLYNYSPYAVGSQVYALSFTRIDARAGVTVGPFSGVSAQLYGRYTSVVDVPVLIRRIGTYFDLDDIQCPSLGARVAYRYGKLVSFDAEAQLMAHGLDRGRATAVDRASFILSADLRVCPIEKLTVGLSYEHRGGRHYYSYVEYSYVNSTPVQTIEMGDVNNLSVWGEYNVSPALAVGLHLENLLDTHPLILPGISAQRLHGLLSATYRF